MEKESIKEAVEVINTELVFPTHTNHYGTIFGGRVLELMDMTGALAAMQFANEDAVTASIEAVDFKKPIKTGDIVELKAKVIYTARTSMVVKVDVFRVGKFGPGKDFTCRGYLGLSRSMQTVSRGLFPRSSSSRTKMRDTGRSVKISRKDAAKDERSRKSTPEIGCSYLNVPALDFIRFALRSRPFTPASVIPSPSS